MSALMFAKGAAASTAKPRTYSKRDRILLPLATMLLWSPFSIQAQGMPDVTAGGTPCETEAPGPDDDILTVKEKRLKLIDGDIYVCREGRWVFNRNIVRPAVRHIEIRKTATGCEMINTKSGATAGLSNAYSSGFEAPSFRRLFRIDDWSTTTLLSPRADSVEKYVELNRQLMSGGRFLDNRIDLEFDNVHSGRNALRFYAVPPGPGMITSKSLIEKNNLCYGKGDHIWFTGWYYIQKGMPATLVDFETRRLLSGPGMRLIIRHNRYASMELKFGDKRQYNQTKVAFPSRRWVHIKLHLWLSNHDDGVIEIWQDGEKILRTTGQTLPTHDTIYNAMQVGITATPRETVLLVDDVVVSDQPL